MVHSPNKTAEHCTFIVKSNSVCWGNKTFIYDLLLLVSIVKE
uniref:Uncharacterized protein n=1 Tax=Arundo donax TaxID=35708 RepID=A0A0A9AY66_ARUDO